MIDYQALLSNTKPYQALLADKRNNRLGHCYMIISEDELACDSLCMMFARAILCDNDGCGDCLSCTRVENKSHAELKILTDYKMQDVQDFIDLAYYKVTEGKYKVMLIPAFDNIAEATQNVLLKTLEEPCENVVFVLGVHRQSRVIDTIKSRAEKLFLERLDNDQIAAVLVEEGNDEERVDRAVACAFGNLTKAKQLVSDNEFVTDYATMISILKDMKTSKDVVNMLDRLSLSKDNKLDKYLDVLEIILKAMLGWKNKTMTRGFEELRELGENFNNAMLVNIFELTQECRRRLESNCKQDNLADMLLMGILEVKYLCR
mgnify:CR=1 FL=1